MQAIRVRLGLSLGLLVLAAVQGAVATTGCGPTRRARVQVEPDEPEPPPMPPPGPAGVPRPRANRDPGKRRVLADGTLETTYKDGRVTITSPKGNLLEMGGCGWKLEYDPRGGSDLIKLTEPSGVIWRKDPDAEIWRSTHRPMAKVFEGTILVTMSGYIDWIPKTPVTRTIGITKRWVNRGLPGGGRLGVLERQGWLDSPYPEDEKLAGILRMVPAQDVGAKLNALAAQGEITLCGKVRRYDEPGAPGDGSSLPWVKKSWIWCQDKEESFYKIDELEMRTGRRKTIRMDAHTYHYFKKRWIMFALPLSGLTLPQFKDVFQTSKIAMYEGIYAQLEKVQGLPDALRNLTREREEYVLRNFLRLHPQYYKTDEQRVQRMKTHWALIKSETQRRLLLARNGDFELLDALEKNGAPDTNLLDERISDYLLRGRIPVGDGYLAAIFVRPFMLVLNKASVAIGDNPVAVAALVTFACFAPQLAHVFVVSFTIMNGGIDGAEALGLIIDGISEGDHGKIKKGITKMIAVAIELDLVFGFPVTAQTAGLLRRTPSLIVKAIRRTAVTRATNELTRVLNRMRPGKPELPPKATPEQVEAALVEYMQEQLPPGQPVPKGHAELLRMYETWQKLSGRPPVQVPTAPPIELPPRHFGADSAAHTAKMNELGLQPRVGEAAYTYVVDGVEFVLGELFEIGGGRVGCFVRIKTTDGMTYLRFMYRSNSQVEFRVLPAYNYGEINNAGYPAYDKGMGEHTLKVPGLQEKLAERVVANQVRRNVPYEVADNLMQTGVRHIRTKLEHSLYEAADATGYPRVTSVDLLAESMLPRLETPSRHRLLQPGEVKIADPQKAPNYDTMVRTYETRSGLSGDAKVTAEVYRSVDGTVEYTIYYINKAEGVWFGDPVAVNGAPNSWGLKGTAYDIGELATPAWEYKSITPPEYVGPLHPTNPNYNNSWGYRRGMPEIKKFYKKRWNEDPPPAPAPPDAPPLPPLEPPEW